MGTSEDTAADAKIKTLNHRGHGGTRGRPRRFAAEAENFIPAAGAQARFLTAHRLRARAGLFDVGQEEFAQGGGVMAFQYAS